MTELTVEEQAAAIRGAISKMTAAERASICTSSVSEMSDEIARMQAEEQAASMTPEQLSVCHHDDIHHGFILVFYDNPPELDIPTLEREVKLDQEVAFAPVPKGQLLGTISLSYNGEVRATVPLLAQYAVNASKFLTVKYQIIQFLSRREVQLAIIAFVVLVVLIVLWWKLLRPKRRYGSRSSRRRRGSSYRGRRRR
jgi:hypothetical protein